MSVAARPLGELNRQELEYLRNAIAKHHVPTPLTLAALTSKGKGALFSRLGPLAGANEVTALALIDLALLAGSADVTTSARPSVLALTVQDLSLLRSGVRATTPVVLDMLGAARERVVMAGFEFNHGAVLFEALHRRMVEHGVKVSIFLDVKPVPSASTSMDAYLALVGHQFLGRNWRFGPPWPSLYYWPAGCAQGSKCSLHAKCIVVDGVQVLIGSANFTRRGFKRNLEIGVQLEDAVLGAALVQQLEHLVDTGHFAKLPALPAAAAVPPPDAEDESEGEAPRPGRAPSAAILDAELLVSVEARPLFARLVAAGLPVPTVGEDVEGDDGEVIGSPELWWDEAHVAVLLPEQEGGRKKLENAGWTCFPLALDDAAFETLCELVRREV